METVALISVVSVLAWFLLAALKKQD